MGSLGPNAKRYRSADACFNVKKGFQRLSIKHQQLL